MRLRVLGCQGPYPGPGRATSGYLLTHGETAVLMDCGSGVLGRLAQVLDIQKLDALLLSHLHADHMCDTLPLKYLLAEQLAGGRRERPLPLYAPQEPPAEWELIAAGGVYEGQMLMPGEEYRIGELTLRCFPGRHPVPSFAFRLEADGKSLVYTGDTNETEGLAHFATGADLLLADGLFLQNDWKETAPHMSAAQCGELARQAGVSRLLLTHLHPGRDPKESLAEAVSFFPTTDLAVEGGEWIV